MSKWRKIKTRTGKPQVRAVLEPLPVGPYFKTEQHRSGHGVLMDVFEAPRLGEEVLDGQGVLCAYWYDTSD